MIKSAGNQRRSSEIAVHGKERHMRALRQVFVAVTVLSFVLGLLVFAIVKSDSSSKKADAGVTPDSAANDAPGSGASDASVPNAAVSASNAAGPPSDPPAAFFPHAVGAQWV